MYKILTSLTIMMLVSGCSSMLDSLSSITSDEISYTEIKTGDQLYTDNDNENISDYVVYSSEEDVISDQAIIETRSLPVIQKSRPRGTIIVKRQVVEKIVTSFPKPKPRPKNIPKKVEKVKQIVTVTSFPIPKPRPKDIPEKIEQIVTLTSFPKPKRNPYPIDLENNPLLKNNFPISPLLKKVRNRNTYDIYYSNDMVDVYYPYNESYPTGDPLYYSERINSDTVIENINVLPTDIAQELICLSLNIYHEARGSTQEDQISTAFVVMNRTKHPVFPDNVCDVVWQYYKTRSGKYIAQFSWTRDGFPDKPRTKKSWIMAQKLAYIAYFGGAPDITSGRLNYYAHGIVNPRWARNSDNKLIIGAHTYLTAKEHTYIIVKNP